MKATVSRQQKIVGYRLGLYDPDPEVKGVRYVGRTYKATEPDVAAMRQTIDRFNELASGDLSVRLCLAAYPLAER